MGTDDRSFPQLFMFQSTCQPAIWTSSENSASYHFFLQSNFLSLCLNVSHPNSSYGLLYYYFYVKRKYKLSSQQEGQLCSGVIFQFFSRKKMTKSPSYRNWLQQGCNSEWQPSRKRFLWPLKAVICKPVAYWNHLGNFSGPPVTGTSPSPIQPESLMVGPGVAMS